MPEHGGGAEMKRENVYMYLIPAVEDDSQGLKYCEERLENSLRSHGVISSGIVLPTLEAAAASGEVQSLGQVGLVVISLAPVLGTLVGAWLQARYGREVRLKIGEIEAEAKRNHAATLE